MTVLLLTCLTRVFAQTEIQKDNKDTEVRTPPKESQVYIGLSGNLNSSWIMYQQTYGEPFLKYQFTMRPGVNLQLGYDWDYNWGIRAEIGYAMLGQKYKDTQYGLPTTRNIKTNYLQIPVLFKFRTYGDHVKFYAMTGFQMNLLLSATQEYLRDGQQPPVFHNPRSDRDIDVGATEIKERYTNVNLGMRFDLGVDIRLTDKLFLNAGISNMYSITNLVDPDWRMRDYKDEFHYSHNFYSGLNVGINYIF